MTAVSDRPASRKDDFYPEAYRTTCPLCGIERIAKRNGTGDFLYPQRPDLGRKWSYTSESHDCPERHKMARLS